MSLCIITARGGSKRIPRKNVRPFCGKPMIVWPIEAAKAAGVFKHILISTDDAEIAEIARQAGAEVPFLRPPHLSDDHTLAHVAARHALEWAEKEWGMVENFCHLYPTAPLLQPETIREGLRLITQTPATNAFTVARLGYPIYQALFLDTDGKPRPIFSRDKAIMRSQDMPATYFDVGQMYWFQTDHFKQHETRVAEDSALVVVPQETALDIDSEEDWSFAETLAQTIRMRTKSPQKPAS